MSGENYSLLGDQPTGASSEPLQRRPSPQRELSTHETVANLTEHTAEFALWRKPYLLRSWHEMEEEERKASWGELFTDLIYVSIIARLSETFREGGDFDLFRYYILYYGVFHTWLETQLYSTWLHSEDVPHLVLYGLIMACVMGQGANLESAFKDVDESIMFPIFVVLPGIFLTIMYVRAACHIKYIRPLMAVKTSIFCWYIFAWITAAVVTRIESLISSRKYIYAGICTLDLLIRTLYVTTLSRRFKAPPIDVAHIIERYGCYSMVMLGESAFAITQTTVGAGAWFYPTTICVLMVMMSIKMLYFDVDSPDLKHHALKRSRWAGLVWSFISHFFVTSSIAMGGALMEVVVGSAIKGKKEVEILVQQRIYLVYSVIVLFLAIMQLCHKPTGGVENRTRRRVGVVLRMTLACGLFGLSFVRHALPPFFVVFVVLALLVPMLIADLSIKFFVARRVAQHKAKSRWRAVLKPHSVNIQRGSQGAGEGLAGKRFLDLVRAHNEQMSGAISPLDEEEQQDVLATVREQGSGLSVFAEQEGDDDDGDDCFVG